MCREAARCVLVRQRKAPGRISRFRVAWMCPLIWRAGRHLFSENSVATPGVRLVRAVRDWEVLYVRSSARITSFGSWANYVLMTRFALRFGILTPLLS